MHSIGRNAPIGNADLAAIERVSPPAMCRIIDSLDNEGWVERSRDPEDRRAVQIELSPEGKELLEAARKRRTAFLNQRLESLGADERERLSGAVEILWALLDDDTAAAPSFDNAPRDAPGDAPGNEPGNDT